ncbi:MAG: helix-turn-helix transcriptional regulator [Bacillota bacterium]
MNSFSSRLRQALKEKGLTQKEAARAIGVTEQAMSNYVSGRIPEARILFRLARLCHRPMEWFLAEDDEAVLLNGPFISIGERIENAMTWAGLTKTELAEALDVSVAEVEAMLRGWQLELSIIPKLCCVLQVTPEWLLCEEGECPPPKRLEIAAAEGDFLNSLVQLIAVVATASPEELKQVAAGKVPGRVLLPEDFNLDCFLCNFRKLLRLQAGRPITVQQP